MPVKQGLPYLRFCIESVLTQESEEFELLVSAEADDLESVAYLQSHEDTRLKILFPPKGLSMTEHWDWLQGHASGSWQMFLGQDDGLQPDFFEWAGTLAEIAERRGLRLINSRRAYVHWPQSHFDPDGRGKVLRLSKTSWSVRSLKSAVWSALLGTKSYFELPHMYTTSLFSRTLIDQCREKMGGRFLTCHPQDANLVALGFSTETHYLFSSKPIGWVGSSKKSAGLSLAPETVEKDPPEEQSQLAAAYLTSISKSQIKYPTWAGDFSLAIDRIYLWQALISTESVQSKQFVKLIKAPLFINMLLARSTVPRRGRLSKRQMDGIKAVAKLNHVKLFWTYEVYRVFSRAIVLLSLFHTAYTRMVYFSLGALGIEGMHFRTSLGGEPTQAPFKFGKTPLD